LNASAGSILLIVAVILFVLSAVGLALGTINLVSLGLAAFAGSFLVGRSWRR
jgi:hypothetical protein